MATFESLIRDIAEKFGLGPQAAALTKNLSSFITEGPGGIAGFLDRFRSAGLGDRVASWIGKSDNPSITTGQLESALGAAPIDTLARKSGLSITQAAPALAFLVPKVIDMLTPDGVVPATVPGDVRAFVGTGGGTTAAAPVAEPRSAHRWWPLLLLALAAALAWWFFGRPAEHVATAPQVTQPAPSSPAKLALTNTDGKVQVGGVVGDEQTRTGILGTLQKVFGAENVSGTIAVDPKVGPASWIANLEAALAKLKIPGLEALFEGDSISIGGLVPQADLDSAKLQLQSLFGSGFTVTSFTDRAAALFTQAKGRALSALAELKAGYTGSDLVRALNLAIINFDSASAGISADSREILERAAAALKAAPAATKIEVGGHTDSTGDAQSNLLLSQQRAETVRTTLIEFGVDPSMLTAKGFGASKPVASNDSPDGRFQNRRIEFVVIE